MPSKKGYKPPSSKAILPFKVGNKYKRQDLHVQRKKAKENVRRDERFRRKREEDKDPRLRRERHERNVPATLDRKRVWDDVNDATEDGLGWAVDVSHFKRQRTEEAESGDEADEDADEDEEAGAFDEGRQEGDGQKESDADSMLDSDESLDDNDDDQANKPPKSRPRRAPSPTRSINSLSSTLTPEALSARFPSLFPPSSDTLTPPPIPKILITTSLNSTLHNEAHLLTTLLPHSVYVPRSAHRYAHKFSLREIASFASNRAYTAIALLKEDQKRPTGLSIVHLPAGPTFHFSISNWLEGRKLPGHGNPTAHVPELILNNFRTPLGLLTAHLFRSLFPPQPELQGRQVVTLHNQRDYIFVRRHRYVFRDRRPTEKTVVGPDGKDVKGAEEIRAGLQELGPRFTMKLRRVDRGIGRAGSGGVVEWEWKGKLDKERTKFQL